MITLPPMDCTQAVTLLAFTLLLVTAKSFYKFLTTAPARFTLVSILRTMIGFMTFFLLLRHPIYKVSQKTLLGDVVVHKGPTGEELKNDMTLVMTNLNKGLHESLEVCLKLTDPFKTAMRVEDRKMAIGLCKVLDLEIKAFNMAVISEFNFMGSPEKVDVFLAPLSSPIKKVIRQRQAQGALVPYVENYSKDLMPFPQQARKKHVTERVEFMNMNQGKFTQVVMETLDQSVMETAMRSDKITKMTQKLLTNMNKILPELAELAFMEAPPQSTVVIQQLSGSSIYKQQQKGMMLHMLDKATGLGNAVLSSLGSTEAGKAVMDVFKALQKGTDVPTMILGFGNNVFGPIRGNMEKLVKGNVDEIRKKMMDMGTMVRRKKPALILLMADTSTSLAVAMYGEDLLKLAKALFVVMTYVLGYRHSKKKK